MTQPRTLTKREATRHLIHAAIRMIFEAEDPYAIHLLVQSAEKVLLDIGKSSGKTLFFDWESNIRPERRKDFFEKYRKTCNYLKHADDDAQRELPVRDLAQNNAIVLFMCINNHKELFEELTEHMKFYSAFVQLVFPDFFPPLDEHHRLEQTARRRLFKGSTPRDIANLAKGLFPSDVLKEKEIDLSDNSLFYDTPSL